MAFQPAPQCVEIKLIMDQNSVPVVNRWNVDVGHAVTPADLTAVQAVFDSWVTTRYAPLLSASVFFVNWIVTDISVFGGAQITTPVTTTQGTLSPTQTAANAALVASLRTGFSGRNFRGRSYVPGMIPASFVDAQHFTPTFAANVNAAFVNLLGDITAIGSKLVVLSRYLAGALRVVALATEIISIITDTKVDSMRRRTAN